MTSDESRTDDGLVPPVTDSYQSAYKNYVLVSALLLSSQLIGISVETKDRWGITLKNPMAVPLILIALVVYFGYKSIIEWLQCDPSRQADNIARIDNLFAHGIGVSALTITFVQLLSQKQVIDIISHYASAMKLLVGLAAIISTVAVNATIYWPKGKKNLGRWLLIFCLLSVAFFAASAFFTAKTAGGYVPVLIATGIGIGVGELLATVVRLEKKRLQKLREMRSKASAAAATHARR